MKKLTGVSANDGIAIATVYKLVDSDLSFKKRTIKNPEKEIDRFEDALRSSGKELISIKKRVLSLLGDKAAQVFQAHIVMMRDPEFVNPIINQIKNNHINAEYALKKVSDRSVRYFDMMVNNHYMQERKNDIVDISKRIMSHLLGKKLPDLSLINKPVVVVTHDLTPSDTAQLNTKYVKGIVADQGGRTSHSAIMARILAMPAIVNTQKITNLVSNNDQIIVDGDSGIVIVNPTHKQVSIYQKKLKLQNQKLNSLNNLKQRKTVTKDKKRVMLSANIGTHNDATTALKNGAEGIGLYRTEFLYMNSDRLPTEDEQFQSYKTVLQRMKNKPVIIRTLDIGGDKQLPYMQMPKEDNPFLGYRAIRFSLNKEDIFRTQLRALLRASNYGDLSIIFPMVSTLGEFRAAKSIYNEERQKMINQNQPVGKIKIGIMVEVPSAAILADQFAKEVDLMSIGTNDLIQYTMAADRGNNYVANLYQPYHPAVLRLIKHVIDACHHEHKPARMCGEMASDPIAMPILLGMGLDEFSMSSSSILKIRSLMKKLDTNKMAKLATKVVHSANTSEDVIEMVKSMVSFQY
ncbi:phosphoenolpyruvate-protein phosphotransferase [Philodulcilactobacillus myokoensis]|uniref:Phosphoenolpyruvate-protein phosphotransferase n=1 Tax=Philodulcilactobacillus myokoensis TaxID=2929573 RepID=A0A9W6B1R2_9LACO|nr:phosphoenolpyruvate--protein phosphotransferase [Philodulcilactobacillus myokoensis]GLB47043.1 phosphoenolpyruvate-protein phosphotransferase [Philodulcilactobacillus myokoensis]